MLHCQIFVPYGCFVIPETRNKFQLQFYLIWSKGKTIVGSLSHYFWLDILNQWLLSKNTGSNWNPFSVCSFLWIQPFHCDFVKHSKCSLLKEWLCFLHRCNHQLIVFTLYFHSQFWCRDVSGSPKVLFCWFLPPSMEQIFADNSGKINGTVIQLVSLKINSLWALSNMDYKICERY
jgi:hypothetical protein